MTTRTWSSLRDRWLVGLCALSASCGSAQKAAQRDELRVLVAPVSFVAVSDTLSSEKDMDALVSPYRNELIAETSRIVGWAEEQFTEARPEGALGNLVADAMLHVVQSLVEDTVHIAVTNNGGLRVPILAGPITVGEIFELAPFENYLTVVELTGTELQALANDIARVGGEPIAGFSFHIDGATERAGGVRVGDEPLRQDGRYRLVTLDYLVDGGDALRTLWEPRPRIRTSVLLRDAIIQYIELRETLRPQLNDRIIGAAR